MLPFPPERGSDDWKVCYNAFTEHFEPTIIDWYGRGQDPFEVTRAGLHGAVIAVWNKLYPGLSGQLSDNEDDLDIVTSVVRSSSYCFGVNLRHDLLRFFNCFGTGGATLPNQPLAFSRESGRKRWRLRKILRYAQTVPLQSRIAIRGLRFYGLTARLSADIRQPR